MCRIIWNPVVIIAGLIILFGFDSAASPEEQAQFLKVRETVWPRKAPIS
jgi:hypothetical protein